MKNRKSMGHSSFAVFFPSGFETMLIVGGIRKSDKDMQKK